MVYLLPVLYLYGNVIGYLKPKHSEQEEFLSLIWLLVANICFNSILAPSFSFMMFYLIIFIISALIHPYFPKLNGESEVEKLSYLILTTCITTFGMLFLFYILQKRELKRFLQQQETD